MHRYAREAVLSGRVENERRWLPFLRSPTNTELLVVRVPSLFTLEKSLYLTRQLQTAQNDGCNV